MLNIRLMSANGELFIQGNLSETASDSGMVDLKKEKLIVKDYHYDIWRESDIPEMDSIQIEDCDSGELLGTLEYKARYIHDAEDGFHETEVIELARDGKTVNLEVAKGDWIDQLNPIINDYLGTCEGETMSQEDSDWLMTTLRAKVEFNQGLITKDEYELIMNDLDR
jgi:hypothetical protein